MNTLHNNSNLQQLFSSFGYKIQTISWEDTARNKGSCYGPNISDMTLMTKNKERMPMIRKPNFKDVTYDVPIEKFKLPVYGKIISLKEYLMDINKYVDNKQISSIYLERDSKILTQNQTCILPCNKGETVEFTVNLYNYQSRTDSPAVLVITVSKEGTSTQIVDGMDNNLYFNNKDKAHYFKARRLGDVRKEQGKSDKAVLDFKEMDSKEKLENCLMIIQVPLVRKPLLRSFCDGAVGGMFYDSDDDCEEESCGYTPEYSQIKKKIRMKGGFDMGNLSVGSYVGKYKGCGDSKLKRDSNYPIRCTYQYYRLSDTPDMNQDLVLNIVEQLDSIKTLADDMGSLVIGKSNRVTEKKPVEVQQMEWNGAQMMA